MIVLSDTGFHAAEGDPANLKLCPRGEWKTACSWRRSSPCLRRSATSSKSCTGCGDFQARLAFTMAAFNVLVQWHGFQPNASGFVPLSMAEFSL